MIHPVSLQEMTQDGITYAGQILPTDKVRRRITGGRDWDQRLIDFSAEQFQSEHGLNPTTDPNSVGRLLRECEDAKRTLSARSKATISVDFGGMASRIPITRQGH